MKPRYKRRGRRRFAWFRALKGKLLSAYINDRHRVRGSDVAGFRVVRIIRARVDRKRRSVTAVVVRLYGGRPDVHGGYNGPTVTLEDRREFVGGCSKGIVHGRDLLPIDAAYAMSLSRRTKGGAL